MVTAKAKASFERAVARDKPEAKARYFLGLAAKQHGKGKTPPPSGMRYLRTRRLGAPWVGFVREALARVSGASLALADQYQRHRHRVEHHNNNATT